MMSFAQPPGSPPELTSSKSSKSSSFHSSSISVTDGGVLSDLTHFEDIELADDRLRSPPPDLYGAGTGAGAGNSKTVGTKINSRTLASSAAAAGRNHPPALPAVRELVNGAVKSSPPMAMGQQTPGLGKNAAARRSNQSLGLPPGGRPALGTPSPSSSLAMAAMRNRSRSRSRSPSPTHMMQGPISARPLSANSPGMSSSSPMIPPPRPRSRHSSSTKPRKTAKEIEAEFHDSDEDLPDDAALWNVPLSPNLYRTASSAVTSAANSASTSPERPAYLAAPSRTFKNGHIQPPKSPMSPQPFPNLTASIVIPESPVRARAPRGSMNERRPENHVFGKNRAKSWDNVLSELSEEARILSEALDAHAAEGEARDREAGGSGGGKTPESGRASMDKLQRAKTTPAISMPPLRKNEVMIDPLPVSREKEKVLSRTRPSWLPPKDRKEEKKHLKEYRRMMEQSLEAEKRRIAKEASAKCARDDTSATLQRIWDEHVLPNWNASIREPRTRELWWRGIPPRCRPEVWKRAITNELGLTATTYEKALARAKAVEASSQRAPPSSSPTADSPSSPVELAWLQAIRRDVLHTFPTLNLFQPGQALHGALVDLLSAYAFYRSDVGYAHGSHLPAALLLLTLPSATEAFTALANFLNRPLPLAFMTGDPAGTGRTYELVLNLLHQKRPKLFRHLFATPRDGGLGMHASEVIDPMVRTLFLNGCCEAPTPVQPLSAPADGAGDAARRRAHQSLPSTPLPTQTSRPLSAVHPSSTSLSTTTLPSNPPRSPLHPHSHSYHSQRQTPPPPPPFQPRPHAPPHAHKSLPAVPTTTFEEGNTPITTTDLITSPGFNPPSRGLSLALAFRLWDVIVFDGDAAIIRACMGILAARESALYGDRGEVLGVLGWSGSLALGGGVLAPENNHAMPMTMTMPGLGLGAEELGVREQERVMREVERAMRTVREVGKEAVPRENGSNKKKKKVMDEVERRLAEIDRNNNGEGNGNGPPVSVQEVGGDEEGEGEGLVQ